jgi:hypothetical protein
MGMINAIQQKIHTLRESSEIGEKVGELQHHFVRHFKQAVGLVRRNTDVAGATIIVYNVAFAKIAFKLICLFDEKIAPKIFGERHNENNKANLTKRVFFVLQMIVANVTLYRWLRPALGPWITTAISVATVATYVKMTSKARNAGASTARHG